ncbi:DUF2018 family protein [uncultured Campylobacter sp.]|uniref:DUF2018 family protein n=1 Tax=uncultured Campylobacter sp. TaxID=218934 RepID=UPI0026277EFD|nr:DUF2018 family protein [uncultured Campylobacter sp.]
MDIFEGGPRGKFFEILSAASPTLVQNEIEEALIRLIACERLCEARGISERESFIAQDRSAGRSERRILQMSKNIPNNDE